MTTVRVRRARGTTLAALGIAPGEGDRELVEVTAHGSLVAVVDAAEAIKSQRSRTIDPVLWHDDAVATTDGLVALVAACPDLMEKAREVHG